MVIDADGRRIPWPEVSRIGNEEMGGLMRQVVNRLYTFHAKSDDLSCAAVPASRYGSPRRTIAQAIRAL